MGCRQEPIKWLQASLLAPKKVRHFMLVALWRRQTGGRTYGHVTTKRGSGHARGTPLLIGHFTVMDGSEAGVDLVLIQTFLLHYPNED